MKHLRDLAAITALVALAACAGGTQNLQSALSACAANPGAHAEVYIPQATVTRVLGERESRSGLHEGFIVRVAQQTFKVEDNVDITGPVPLQRGDAVSLLGQLECDDYVIHWTHHDPRARHPAGYIKVNGRLYE
ncbi:MAG TPA: DUF3465 domain-containing protein [Candidatus Baltobacteraceae bacterium]|nr:DUF3465 domain-containing protein [Candidatus Baltobacteraceae bacterium]